MIFSPASSTKFVNVPFLPKCMAISIKQGNPTKGPFVTFARIATGCVVPWHWHTANVELYFVSGTGTHELQAGHIVAQVHPGDFFYLPAKSIHSFRCTSTCLVYNVSDRPDIIHWVDRNGNVVSQADALVLNEGP
ncbi:MAG TPA: cupin domain-containing protein [Candidatus Eremiobacteraceae bacterium]